MVLVSLVFLNFILYFGFFFFNLFVVFVFYWMIGFFYFDGLVDWVDGIMVKGDRERKIEVMKDVNMGIVGFFVVVIVFFF